MTGGECGMISVGDTWFWGVIWLDLGENAVVATIGRGRVVRVLWGVYESM